MELNRKQEEGLKIAVQRYRDHEKYTVISGYAGTGKSTLVRFIIEALNLDEDDVVYATYTGKAAQVLAKKGNKNVTTLHKLLYESFPRPNGTFFRRPRPEIEYHVVVVDEVSMAPKTLMDLLFKHHAYVICLGDPFQLPPIDKDEDNHLLDNPHIFLDEIMRQEAESEIIRLTMAIRNYESIPNMSGNEVQILNKEELTTGMMQWADQILVGTNNTRKSINTQMRKLCGMNDIKPMEGDKVICLRNYWGVLSEQANDLINGTIGYLQNKFDTVHYLPQYVGGGTIDVTIANFITDSDDSYSNLAMDTYMIMTGDKCMSRATAYKLTKNPRTAGIVPYEFTYGYAITTHKAQGSSWPNVLVIEEGFPFDRKDHARWLYTACTRPEKKLVLLR